MLGLVVVGFVLKLEMNELRVMISDFWVLEDRIKNTQA
jgi:hypothetical protein